MHQYLQCINCQRLLGDGSLICELGHPLCSSCGKPGEHCQTCSMYTPDLKAFTSNLRPNLEIMDLLKKIFARCKNEKCKHLFPLYLYEKHSNSCQNGPNKVACIHGCGIMTKKLGVHLIKKHGLNREDISGTRSLKIYSLNNDWGSSVWTEIVVFISNHLSVLVAPKVEKDVFSLSLYNLNTTSISLKLKVKKGWNSITFEGNVPFYEETLIKTFEPVFWNCQINIIKDRFLSIDPANGKPMLEFEISVIS